ncbi:MAG: sigma-70 family RNA polymerase sigma factor [Planctomycetaceae bacterium]|nr:sigma-70 family RNA polymerase sigma factor [Planctomycetaceae bacterium]
MATNNSDDFSQAFEACVRNLTRDTARALSELFDLTAQRLVRFAMTITGNQADAEDALQGAFSRIAGKPRLLANADAPWPYLIRTVRNESLRVLQKRRHPIVENADSRAHDPDPESVFIHEETADQVRRILQTLPRAQYEVVILKHWEDLTFAEIAEALGLSQNTVASRYRYAMEKLQRSLETLVKP